ncbi:hypothetical protein [Streptomyces sp. NBC_00878]|uniref:hypothetical protein n=1 Tax=Streptomyces sp. NBC_00878 TaxID=2975854 RepID=UPI002252C9A6|nr:hypothetical protein [Streptomyces sp. NBC_00878]MCX4904648.1 hypothetical protein [Streptomyces sp. NBC_00878]
MSIWRNNREQRHSVGIECPTNPGGKSVPSAAGSKHRQLSKRSIVTSGICLSILGTAVLVMPAEGATRDSGGAPLGLPVGTWNQIVHLPHADEQTMVSFHADGTVSGIAPAASLPCPSGTGTCTLGSASLGRWRSTGGNTLQFVLKEYVYDTNGNLVNFIIPKVQVTLSDGGNSYHGKSTTGFWTTGDQLLFTAGSTADATRMPFPSY